MTQRDYYEILGVSKESSLDEIKRAYRKLAMKYHPDRVPGDQRKEAEERFKEISEAYAVLSDETKRAQYDRFGHAGINNQYSAEDIFRGADFGSIFEDLGFGGGIFEDIFSGLGLGGGRRRSGPRRGADLEQELKLTLEEAATGCEKAVTVRRHETCAACSGQGAKPGTKKETCSTCKGMGQVGQSAGFFTISRTCERCQGQGTIIQTPCANCRGSGLTRVERKIDVKIPAGVDSGAHLRVRSEGEPGAQGGPRGDLYILIRLEPHNFFERHQNDVYCKIPIAFVQAALGTELDVPTLYAETIKLKIPAGTQSGEGFRLKGKGFSDLRGYGKGDQYVQVSVAVPKTLNAQQKKALLEFAKLSEEAKTDSITDKIKNAFK